MKRAFNLSFVLTTFFGAAVASSAFAQDASKADLIARGQYLATAADCSACHTADGGKPFAGGKAIATPLGDIFASNITPSKANGIGDYSEEDFDRALRRGIRKDGAQLYPAMPYTAYAGVTDDDVKALYAYFTQGVQPVDAAAQKTALPFPFSIRASMMGWNLLFLHTKQFTPDPVHDAEWNRGAYLAGTLAHCSTCHTPRNLLMAEKSGEAFSGASLGTWYAPNITSDKEHGIGSWSTAQLQSYLSTGHSGNGSEAGGPMLEAIDKSFSKLSSADVKALTVYIAAVPAKVGLPAPGQTTQSSVIDNDLTLIGGTASAGEDLYDAHCSTCHGASGTGGNGLPALLGNAAFKRPTADNVAMAILGGLDPSRGQAMPAFGNVLDDQKIAELTNFLFKQFGDAGVQVTDKRVAELRAGGAPSALLEMAQYGLIAASAVIVVMVLLVIGYLVKRRRRRFA